MGKFKWTSGKKTYNQNRLNDDGTYLTSLYNNWLELLSKEKNMVFYFSEESLYYAEKRVLKIREKISNFISEFDTSVRVDYRSVKDNIKMLDMGTIKIEKSEEAINIYISPTSHFSYTFQDNNEKIFETYSRTKIQLTVFKNGEVYKKGFKGKFKPLILREIIYLSEISRIINSFFEAIFLSKEQPIYKDILRDFYKQKISVPMTVNEIANYTSYKALLSGHYKTYKNIPNSVNKMPLEEAVAKTKLCKIINENEHQKIYKFNIPTHMEHCDEISLLMEYYKTNIANKKEITRDFIADYYRMSKALHQNVNLKIKSYKKLIDAHNDLVYPYMQKKAKQAGKSRMAVNEKFKNLKLPSDWELIKSGQRLFREGENMHHCVYSYLNAVNRGNCCIAHLEYNNIPYTLEIREKENQYYCNQLYSKYDAPATEEVWEYVNKILKEV